MCNPRLRWWTATGIAVLCLLVRFWPLLFGRTLLFGDNYSLMVPGKLLIAEWLRQGIVPLWNPYALGGLSLVGDINQSLWYPSTVLFVLFSPATALNLVILSHELIAFLGMFGLSWQWLQTMAAHDGSHAVETVHTSRKSAQKTAAMHSTAILFTDEWVRFWLACLAGVLWMFSPQVSGAINNIATIQSIVWLPAIIWAGLQLSAAQSWRRVWLRVAVVVLLLTVQFAGGYPQHVLFSGVAAVGFSLIGRTTRETWVGIMRWSLVVLLLLGLSALWWMPFRETLAESTRTLQSTTQAGAGSLHPADLLKMVAPYFFDNPVLGMKWGPQWNSMPNLSLYVGWLPLVMLSTLLLLRKFTKLDYVIGGTLVGTILFAFGDRLPLLRLLQELSSIFRFSRGPSTILMVTTVLLILWIISRLQLFQLVLTKRNQVTSAPKTQTTFAWFWHQFLSWWLSKASLIWLVLFVSMTGLFIAIWRDATWWWQLLVRLSGGAIAHSPFHTPAKDQIIGMSITGNLAVNACLLWLSWHMVRRKWWPGLVAVMALELLINTQGLFFFAPAQVYPTTDQLRQGAAFQLTQQMAQGERVLIRNYNAPYTDFGAYWEALAVRAPFSDSYIDTQEMREYQQLRRLAMGLTPAWNVPVGVQSLTGYTTLLPASLNQVFGNQQQVAINNLPSIPLTHPGLTQWGVSYYLVDSAFQMQEDLSQLKLVGQRDNWQLYALPTPASRFQWLDGSRAEFTQLNETPNQLELHITVPASQSALVIADRFAPGWTASVNGVVTPIEAVSGRRKIAVTDGQHQVVLRYQPSSVRLGGVISGATILIWLGGWWWLHQRLRK